MARSPAKAIPGTTACAKSSGAHTLPYRLHHRYRRTRRRLRRRKALVQGNPRNHREIRSAGGVRLSDLRHRADRRRDRSGLQGRAAQKFGKPVIPVNSPGFAGVKNLGNKLGGEALLDYVIGTEEPEFTTPYDINIIGEYNLSGELWQVKPLLDHWACACWPASRRCALPRSGPSHRAKAAMMVCSKAMINIARKMEERYKIPFFEGSFYGIGDMCDSLREIAKLLVQHGAPDDIAGPHRSADRR